MGRSGPLDRSTTWPYEDGEPGVFVYSRYGGPTLADAEAALGELDGGEAVLFASGTAASAAVVLALLEPRKTVALAEGAYYGTGVLLDELGRWGLRHVEFDQTGAPPADADLVWLEAPSNPFLTMPGFEAAAASPALVLCDSTAATPLNVRPLERGCELALHCDVRVVSDHASTQVGLPEVKLGILPGFGGTQLLARLVGLPKALPLILEGKLLRPKQAWKVGLADRVVPSSKLLAAAREECEKLAKAGRKAKPRRRHQPPSSFFFRAASPDWKTPVMALTAASSESSGGGSLLT